MENKSGKLVTPIGDFNCQSFPILEDKKYFITDEELEKLGKHELKWNYEEEIIDDKKIIHCSLIPNDNTQELLVNNARQEKAEILKWLADNDWKVNKVFIGEWEKDDKRWIEYLENRNIKRERLDEIENILKEE